MEAVLENFKAIPCPAGDRCANANCQFGHPRDRKSPSPSQDERKPRKRQRVAGEDDEQTTPASAKPAETAPVRIQTATKSVSPPPLKHKLRQPQPQPPASKPINIPAARTPLTPHTPRITAAARTPATPASSSALTPTPKVARKPEALNPRHLRSHQPAAHEFRYKAVKMMHDRFVVLNDELKKIATKPEEKKLLLSPQELIWMALDEEEKMALEKPAVYPTVIRNRALHYKRMDVSKWKEDRLAEQKKRVEAAAAVKKASQPILGPPKVIDTGLTPKQEVAILPHLYTPIEKLAEHGYVPKPPTEQEIAKAKEGQAMSHGYEECARCKQRFQVFPGRREEDGALTTNGRCTYHHGRAYFASSTVKKYKCCNEAVSETAGCIQGDTHVFNHKSPAALATVIPFVNTPENPNVPKDRAVCFDCEMGYTVHGFELIRVTATSWPDGRELLDVLVRPVGEILDLNSRYSGIWPEDLLKAESYTFSSSSGDITTKDMPKKKEGDGKKEGKKMKVVPSPVVARDLLFSLISPETPLIGHGLENDLKAMRICHPTLIDTVLLFPHKKGLPIRHGLKMLMEMHLNKIIQVDEVDPATGRMMGHDSAEDARAAGDLVRLKVQQKWQKMKADGWKIVDGVFVPPGFAPTTTTAKINTPTPVKREGLLTEEFIEKGQLGSGGGVDGKGSEKKKHKRVESGSEDELRKRAAFKDAFAEGVAERKKRALEEREKGDSSSE
ncbi:hypothetical protein QBC46DRAFT_380417 [Diplogelasinospora grovesii]|uniref:Exonuclease domain-containing protein n=1 Tax=Diplogelasinospora grovesii TaxID=303347 RepID=A0AAN6S5V6_9PEZI|nr:hypothetical protein QBC46DRAFT_380417 [Diplogelasinospora grovesii]